MAMTRSPFTLLALALCAAPAFSQEVGFAAEANRASQRLSADRAGLGLDGRHAFQAFRAHRDELGQVHTRFQQTYQGLKVWGGEVIVHQDAEGSFRPHTLAHHPSLYLNPVPSLEASEALAAAHAALAPKGGYAYTPTAELVIFPVRQSITVSRPHDLDGGVTSATRNVVRYALAYHVHTELENGKVETRHTDFMIDAHTGAVLLQWDSLRTGAVTGTGQSQWYGTVSLNTNSTSSGYEMRDMTRGAGGTFGNNITTNLNHGTSGNGTIYTDTDNAWGDGNGYGSGTTTSTTGPTGQTAAVDAHHGLQRTWDFYKNVFGRNGIDNTGKATYNRMHYSSNYDNAFWSDSCFCMTYGDGAPPSGSYGEADLDTAGHEMSHGVCATTANLTYSGESGGLNESNSDIFGTCVEFYTLGANGAGSVVPDNPGSGAVTANYTMFENSWGHPGQALRYMYRPDLDGSSLNYWYSGMGSADVHFTSGPNNRMFYFLAKGATTTGDTSTSVNVAGNGVTNANFLPSGMTGIGNDKAARIWYRALTVYLTSSSDYAAARAACISAAKDLYGAGGAEEAAVWNAYHGINVGAAWTGSATAPAITGQPASVTVNAGQTATFSVTATGTAPLSYQWRKNGTNISGATSASYTTPATTSTDNGATFSVVVSNSAGSATSNNATLTVTSGGSTSYTEVESNDTIATANVVSSTVTSITGNLTVSTDVDYYAITLAAGEKIAVNMTGPTGPDWDLYLVNSAGTTLTSSTGSTTSESMTYTNSGSSSVTVYIKTIVYSGTSSTPYTLALTRTTPAPSVTYTEVESNNTQATANAVADNVTKIVGYIGSSTDNDYFNVNVAAGKTLTVNMTGPTGSTYDYDLYLYNTAGTQLAASEGSTTTESVTWTNSGSATAVVTIAVKRYAGSSTSIPYNLALTR
jgi:Zn-dependent metalloprotease